MSRRVTFTCDCGCKKLGDGEGWIIVDHLIPLKDTDFGLRLQHTVHLSSFDCLARWSIRLQLLPNLRHALERAPDVHGELSVEGLKGIVAW